MPPTTKVGVTSPVVKTNPAIGAATPATIAKVAEEKEKPALNDDGFLPGADLTPAQVEDHNNKMRQL